jgi:hypothetical protein
VFPAHRHGALRTGVTMLLGALIVLGPIPSQAASVTLLWTAPGDDSLLGRATAYDLRYSISLITTANFSLATLVPGLPAPQMSGSAERFTVNGLTGGQNYYFCIRTRDEVGNWSAISNVVFTASRTTGVDPDAPGFWFSESRPNPARGNVRFSFSLIRAAQVQAIVTDIAGRRVCTLASGQFPAGRGDLSWDTRSESGASVAPGVYLVRAEIDGTRFVRRVVVER